LFGGGQVAYSCEQEENRQGAWGMEHGAKTVSAQGHVERSEIPITMV